MRSESASMRMLLPVLDEQMAKSENCACDPTTDMRNTVGTACEKKEATSRNRARSTASSRSLDENSVVVVVVVAVAGVDGFLLSIE